MVNPAVEVNNLKEQKKKKQASERDSNPYTGIT